ncbi:MAG: phenylalanine--tRNA ligase subunit alpha [Alphaproteobacteria bacterium]|nr:MAG: phenylalanine--tRNA ligase subunit alpha [Alphaproteobacteria bacterium]
MLESVKTLKDLENEKVQHLGKSGTITKMYQDLRALDGEEKKQKGQEINKLKEEFEAAYNAKKAELEEQELNTKLQTESIDISLEPRLAKKGALHPLTHSIETIKQHFLAQGFTLETGPEIEEDFYNFDALNIPKHHPARQSHDTFYIGEKLLRTHTSNVQIRTMEQRKPPLRLISIGRVYRADDVDATHAPMFHQFECMVIDETTNMSHLKGTLENFFQHAFDDKNLEIRFRPSFFPFTEPSFEVDIKLKGKWVEILGCGMVHPNVLKNVGIDPEKYQGFAFGMGVERFTMIKYGLNDLRLLYNNDLRFLAAFK